jgi:hypothetical protein
MTLLELKDLHRKEIPLRYVNEYSGAAVFERPEFQGSGRVERPVEFRIEHSALGKRNIQVKLLGGLDYPLLPVLRRLKEHISHLDERGMLPRQ